MPLAQNVFFRSQSPPLHVSRPLPLPFCFCPFSFFFLGGSCPLSGSLPDRHLHHCHPKTQLARRGYFERGEKRKRKSVFLIAFFFRFPSLHRRVHAGRARHRPRYHRTHTDKRTPETNKEKKRQYGAPPDDGAKTRFCNNNWPLSFGGRRHAAGTRGRPCRGRRVPLRAGVRRPLLALQPRDEVLLRRGLRARLGCPSVSRAVRTGGVETHSLHHGAAGRLCQCRRRVAQPPLRSRRDRQWHTPWPPPALWAALQRPRGVCRCRG